LAVTEGRAGDALPITIRGVTKTYGRVHALDNVNLEVRSGEFLTLLGPSGSGKTTLLMVLAGFTRPDRGSVRFGEQEMVRTAPHRRDVGMVFQNYALFPHMNVAANVAFPLKLRGVPRTEMVERVKGTLETVQLGGFGGRGIDQLSGGQKQRVALARAIVFEPRILLMDEPLSALDKKLREHMQIELRRLHDKLGMTTVYVTHDQREALTMSDRIAVINFGRVMQLGAPDEIYERPQNAFVADFIGESTFVPVTVEGGVVSYAGSRIRTGRHDLADGRATLVLRPERLRILSNGTEASLNCFTATIRDVVYQGETFLLYVLLEDGTEVSVRGVTRRGGRDGVPSSGTAVTLGLDPEDTVLIPDEGA
jgi:putative spermidine/putrescine transport system ATP-binding protein